MKFTNKKSKSLYKAIYSVFVIILGLFLYYNYLISTVQVLQSYQVLIILAIYLIVFLYWYKKAKYIEYDSNGLGLVFISKGFLFSDINNYREQRIEIPKKRLTKFKIKNLFFFKKMYLYIDTHNTIKKVSFDISFLGRKKTKALKQSLNKVVQENLSK